ncbi:hypothetical protein BCR32DRAFT_241568 [Anaeromyces robustus]|uniref:Uncharacterized protein n=1 Tax=Anaeromyces robustus TaxID=1754192 RepID=A0A1Y1XIY2_9FUNG|nr:hypothetical protein BCR32DRAFT_241568 [Anaeromyces robustus]|eukprot:ORX85715.1 hypothetical protein BCR32DRAFT_241568 [Anaeromyces robustus]
MGKGKTSKKNVPNLVDIFSNFSKEEQTNIINNILRLGLKSLENQDNSKNCGCVTSKKKKIVDESYESSDNDTIIIEESSSEESNEISSLYPDWWGYDSQENNNNINNNKINNYHRKMIDESIQVTLSGHSYIKQKPYNKNKKKAEKVNVEYFQCSKSPGKKPWKLQSTQTDNLDSYSSDEDEKTILFNNGKNKLNNHPKISPELPICFNNRYPKKKSEFYTIPFFDSPISKPNSLKPPLLKKTQLSNSVNTSPKRSQMKNVNNSNIPKSNVDNLLYNTLEQKNYTPKTPILDSNSIPKIYQQNNISSPLKTPVSILNNTNHISTINNISPNRKFFSSSPNHNEYEIKLNSDIQSINIKYSPINKNNKNKNNEESYENNSSQLSKDELLTEGSITNNNDKHVSNISNYSDKLNKYNDLNRNYVNESPKKRIKEQIWKHLLNSKEKRSLYGNNKPIINVVDSNIDTENMNNANGSYYSCETPLSTQIKTKQEKYKRSMKEEDLNISNNTQLNILTTSNTDNYNIFDIANNYVNNYNKFKIYLNFIKKDIFNMN